MTKTFSASNLDLAAGWRALPGVLEARDNAKREVSVHVTVLLNFFNELTQEIP